MPRYLLQAFMHRLSSSRGLKPIPTRQFSYDLENPIELYVYNTEMVVHHTQGLFGAIIVLEQSIKDSAVFTHTKLTGSQ